MCKIISLSYNITLKHNQLFIKPLEDFLFSNHANHFSFEQIENVDRQNFEHKQHLIS